MSIAKKIGFSFLICVLFTLTLFISSDHTAMASTVPKYNFRFKVNNKEIPSEGEYELKHSEAFIDIVSDVTPADMSVTWTSSRTSVVSVDNEDFGKDTVRIFREGPGYTTITAKIDADGHKFNISMNVKVQLFVDTVGTGMVSEAPTKPDTKFLRLDTVGETRQIKLKYIDYTKDDGSVVTGGAITIDPDAFDFQSSNEGVATVDKYGLIKSEGSGYAEITITFTASDRPLVTTMRVVVKPTFNLTFDNEGGTVTYASNDTRDVSLVGQDIPREFTLLANAKAAQNLIWEVWDTSTNKKLGPDSDKLNYSVSTYSGRVAFSNVKAGTYEIYAYTKSGYDYTTNAPYAYMKFAVPIVMDYTELYMQVGDSFSILENSNIHDATSFTYSTSSGAGNYVKLDPEGIITAKKKGYAEIKCVPDPALNLLPAEGFTIKVHVIDGISLNITNAVMNTNGTLLLMANVTDEAAPVKWESSDTKIATVVGGLVTALKPGKVTITASQVIGGLVKKATCTIEIQQAVSKIVIDPATVLLNAGEKATLGAIITPNNLSNVKLRWTSSNENVVKFFEVGNLTATIQAVNSGNAVITAINQENVVVGYSHVTVKQKVTKITLSETNISVSQSVGKVQLRASVYPDSASEKTIYWSSSDTSKATVDANGLVTLKSTGTVTITATAKDDTNVTALCNINILAPVSSISLDERAKLMYTGQTARLTYKLMPANASTTGITWTSSNPSVASVDGTGLVSARSTGTTVIVARTVDGGYTSFCTITVQRLATGIKLDRTSLDLKVGESYVLKPSLIPADSNETKITWESTDTKIATVDANGKVTAKANGSALIIAKIPSGSSVYCRVTVSQPVSGLILNYTEKTIYIKTDFELKVSVSPSTASQPEVTWSSSNEAVATVSSTGIVTGISGGTATITCTTKDGGYTATCIVKVRDGKPTVYLNYDSYYLGLDSSVTLTATVSDGADTSDDVYWVTSDSEIATVNQKGKVTAKKLGRVTITAYAQDGSEAEASCEIRVVRPASSVSINYASLNLLIGQAKQLKVTIKPSNATIKTVDWSSSDPEVASVDEDGNVYGVAEGTAIITATTKDNSGKKAISYVTVNKRVASTGITLQDKQVVLIPGEEKIVGMALVPSNSTDSVTWSTDNAAVAKVDKKTGKITARATGVAYVTAMTETGKTATVEVLVIGLNYTELTLEQYTTYPYKLEVEGATGNVSWNIDNPQVAVINNGTVSSRGVGTAKITAQVNGRKLTCKLKVVKIK